MGKAFTPAPLQAQQQTSMAPPRAGSRDTLAGRTKAEPRSSWWSSDRQWMDTASRPAPSPMLVQRKSADTKPGHASSLPAHGNGHPLPNGVRAKMEHAFRTDFSSVRIHEGPEPRGLGALAYTQGKDIHFAPGQYDPSSQRGQALLGHELAHVVQQSQGRVRATTQAKGVAINHDAALEKEADELGARAARTVIDDATAQKAKEVLAQNGAPFDEGPVQAKSAAVRLHSVADCETWFEQCNEGCRRLPNRTKSDKARRALCWSRCMAEYAACLATARETLTFAAIVAAIVLAAADGPLPIGDAAAAALLISLGILPE
jgi:hypothetical protein